jgi:hypothetical protein
MVGGPRQQIQKKIGAAEVTKDRISKVAAIGCMIFNIDSFATGSQFSDGAPGPHSSRVATSHDDRPTNLPQEEEEDATPSAEDTMPCRSLTHRLVAKA